MCLTLKEKENQVINLLLGYNQKVNFLHSDGLERLLRAIVPSREGPKINRTMNFLTIEISVPERMCVFSYLSLTNALIIH